MRRFYVGKWSLEENESHRQLVFHNVIHGMNELLDAMQDLDLDLSDDNLANMAFVRNHSTVPIPLGTPFPVELYKPLRSLWDDPNVQTAWD